MLQNDLNKHDLTLISHISAKKILMTMHGDRLLTFTQEKSYIFSGNVKLLSTCVPSILTEHSSDGQTIPESKYKG